MKAPDDRPGLRSGSRRNYFFFLSGRCVSAEPAALLAAGDLEVFSTFEAFEPAFLPVCSFFAINDLQARCPLPMTEQAVRLTT